VNPNCLRLRRIYRAVLVWRAHGLLLRAVEQQNTIVGAIPEGDPRRETETNVLVATTAALLRTGQLIGFDTFADLKAKRDGGAA
jgi:hypothetical protein